MINREKEDEPDFFLSIKELENEKAISRYAGLIIGLLLGVLITIGSFIWAGVI